VDSGSSVPYLVLGLHVTHFNIRQKSDQVKMVFDCRTFVVAMSDIIYENIVFNSIIHDMSSHRDALPA
jgi:hypothetical protein